MIKKLLLSFILVGSTVQIECGIKQYMSNFWQKKNTKKVCQALVATGTNWGISEILRYTYPGSQNFRGMLAMILATPLAKSIKSSRHKYLISLSVPFIELLMVNALNFSFQGDGDIALQYLAASLMLIGDDLRSISGRAEGEGFIDHLIQEDDETEEFTSDIEMQDYEAVADTSSGSASLNDSGSSDHSESDEASQTSAEENV